MASKDIKIIIETLLKSEKFKKGVQAMNTTAEKSTKIMSGFKKVLAGISVAFVATKIIAGFKQVIKVGMEFEQSIANVASVSGGARIELEKLAREAGMNTVFSARQAADAMYFLASAGLNVKDMAHVLTPTLNLAAAAQMGIAEATDIVVNNLKVFKAKMSDAEKFTDIMAKTVSSSNTNMQQLGDALSYAGASAAVTGASFKDINILIASMADQGIKGSRAGMQLRMAFTRLLDPTTQAQEVLKKYNLNVEEIQQLLPTPLKLLEKMRGAFMAEEDAIVRAADANKIFGVRQANVTALMLTGEKFIKKNTEAISKYGGAAQKMADVQLDTLQSDLKLLNSAWEEQAIAITKKFTPALRTGIQIITELIKPEKNLRQTTNDLVKITREYKDVTNELAIESDRLTINEKAKLEVRKAELRLNIAKRLKQVNDQYKEQIKLQEKLPTQITTLTEKQKKQIRVLRDTEQEIKDIQAGRIDFTNKMDTAESRLMDLQIARTRLLGQMRDTTIEVAEKEEELIIANAEIAESVDSIAFALKNQLLTENDLVGIAPEIISQAKERAKTINLVTDVINKNTDTTDENTETILKNTGTIINAYKRELATLKKTDDYARQRVALRAKYGKEIVDTIANYSQQAFNITGQFMSNSETRLDQQHKKELSALEKRYEDGLITEDEYNKSKKKMEREQAIESAKLQRKAAVVEKAAALFSIAASTASGIMGIWGAPPYGPWATPGKIARTAMVSGFGIAQAIAAGAKPLPDIPSFQRGTASTKEGPAYLHDDERILTKQQNIAGISNSMFADAAMRGMDFGKEATYNQSTNTNNQKYITLSGVTIQSNNANDMLTQLEELAENTNTRILRR